MIKCKFCGAENPDGTRFCSSCGAKTEETPVVEAVVNNKADSTPRKRNSLKGGLLAWSIVNTVLGMAGCCTLFPFASVILGVVAIIFTVLAQDCQNEKDEKSKIKVATILNIIASAILIISLIILIVCVIRSFSLYQYQTPYQHFDIDDFMDMYPYLD